MIVFVFMLVLVDVFANVFVTVLVFMLVFLNVYVNMLVNVLELMLVFVNVFMLCPCSCSRPWLVISPSNASQEREPVNTCGETHVGCLVVPLHRLLNLPYLFRYLYKPISLKSIPLESVLHQTCRLAPNIEILLIGAQGPT